MVEYAYFWQFVGFLGGCVFGFSVKYFWDKKLKKIFEQELRIIKTEKENLENTIKKLKNEIISLKGK